ncbi:VanZ family protein [Natronoflexus pectinivorans]|uniref:VanZ like protein n=1 Tax=Natronoflexus pectinivorans TaxID=682526 RepID=A0A4R2GRZ1_9BACT|nr:VanZ family protein [Natronoflexus pectinivorans]TCO10956.1 VanZ like protein [Natronoflexus pectinivorans]
MQSIISLISQFKLTILVCAVVVFLSLLPSSEVPNHNIWNFQGSDKIVHFLMYFAISFTLFFEKYLRNKLHQFSIKNRVNLIPIIGLIVASGIIELIQPPISNRSCELFDFIANVLGVVAGFYLFSLAIKILKH